MSLPLNLSLAWRVAGSRRLAQVSFLVRVLGIAFATLVLLYASSVQGALDERGDRATWRTFWPETSTSPEEAWLQVNWSDDFYLDKQISRVQVVQLAPEAPVPPGLPRLPQPGEAFVSPALAKLIASDPEVLGLRYGDTIAGLIGDVGLKDRGELVAVSGYTREQVGNMGVFDRELPQGYAQNGVTPFMRAVIVVGVVVLLFPIALFIGAAARLDAQESDRRLAALRLAGADVQRVRWLVALEGVLAALPGMLLGLGLFFVVRPLVARIEFGGAGFLPSDFSLGGLSFAVLALIPVAVVAASLVGLRDVEISPLGVSRKAGRRDVRPIGLLFLLPGFALLWFVLDIWAGMSGRIGFLDPTFGLVTSIILILIGVALIGTWLGQHVARWLANRMSSGPILLAFRRVSAEPEASFRAVSGVTFAVFAGVLFLSLSAALEREVQVQPSPSLRPGVIAVHHDVQHQPPLEDLPAGTEVVSVVTLSGETTEGWYVDVQQGDCDALARVLQMQGGCGGRIAVREHSSVEPGASLLVLGADGREERVMIPADAYVFSAAGYGWVPDALLPPGELALFEEIRGGTLVVAPPAGIGPDDRVFEQIRTALIRAAPAGFVYSGQEYEVDRLGGLTRLKNLVYMGTFAAFALSGATAAMAVAGSILARRQAFALLRMAGCSLASLRQTVMAEATLPLALVSLLSAGTAVAVSALMIWRVGEGSILPPPAFALPLGAGLVLGLLLPLITLPLLSLVTRTEQVRFE